ncbi:two-component regulator propeller domain-containing protein [Dyella sp. 20L07]|uniref:two-component regulator propeller domain-containing protein n=1 Tax=Dyella sp. 20L07 TaxID=3384240 RepID=UPI003D2670F7
MQLPIAILGRDVGLDKQEVRSLYQDHEGFVWAGTDQGLYLFDGVSFLKMDSSQGFRPSEVMGMAGDDSGDLWVATAAGIQLRHQGRFAALDPAGKSLLADRGQTLAIQAPGTLLLVSHKQLWVVTRDSSGDWQMKPMFSQQQRQENPALDQIGMVAVQGGDIWLSCGDGLCRLQKGQVQHFGPAEGVPSNDWQGLLPTSDGGVWAQGQSKLLRWASGAPRFIEQNIPAGQEWPSGAAGLLAEDTRGNIVVGTKTGLLRLEGHTWKVYGDTFGLMPVPIKPISTLLVDRDGSLWLGNEGWGVLHWAASRAVETWSAWSGWSGGEPPMLKEIDSLTLWTPDDRPPPPDDSDQRNHRWPLTSLPPGQAHMERITSDGSVWTFHFDGRITRRSRGSNRTSTVADLKNYIRGVKKSRSGEFWIYTQGGIDTLRPESGEVRHATGLLPGTSCFDVAEDNSGRMWAACNTGLYRDDGQWNHVTVHPVNSADGYEKIAFTPDGRLWAGTSHADLLVGNAIVSDDIVMHAVDNDALRRGTRLDFLETDKRGWLWVGSSIGLDIFDGSRWTRLASRDGLLLDESGAIAFYAADDGSAWINSKAGLTRLVDPVQLLASPKWNARVIAADYDGHDLFSNPLDRFDEGKILTLHLAVLGNSAANPVRYRYRLDGVDKDWQEMEGSTVSYLMASPGTFHFKVQAVDLNRGHVTDTGEWTVVLDAPWWRSPWLSLFVLPFLAIGMIFIWHWRSRALIEKSRQLEKTVDQRTAQLKTALHARNELLARISHDLRSPLSNIIECVNLWRIGDTKHEYPRIIEQSVWQQIGLIDDLLEYAQDEHANAELEEVAGYLHAFLVEVAGQAGLMAERGSNRFVSRFDKNLPTLIKADFRRLRQVLMNLLANAAKFTRDGLVEFDVRMEQRDTSHVRLRFVVRDNGIGLGSDEIDSLIKPFVRGTNVEHREGSGLGLSIVTQWVNRMNSRLQAHQLTTGGSEFFFVVNFDIASESDTLSSLLNDDPMDHVIDGQDRVIVVVDDQLQNRDMLCDLLDSYGFSCVPASNGRDALNIIEERNPSLVITDQYMDGMDGWMLLSALRKTHPHVPVILCSASPPQRPSSYPSNLEFDATLLKPTSIRQLLQIVVSKLEVVA